MTVESHRITSREEWLEWRRRDLTASDVAAAAGFSERRSPLSVYAAKTGMVEPEGDNVLLRRGRWLEPAVVQALREKRPDWSIRRADVYLRRPDVRLGATPDAIAEVPGYSGLVNVQLKVVARTIFDRDWAEDSAPVEYQVQTLTEGSLMDAVSPIAHNVIAALVVGEYYAELEIRDVPRHRQAEERAVEVAREFWGRVARGDPPPMVYEQDAELVARLHPESVPGKMVDLRGDNRMPVLLDERARLKAEIKARNAALAVLETEAKAKLADAEAALVQGWRVVSFKTSARKAYAVPAGLIRTLRALRDENEEEEA